MTMIPISTASICNIMMESWKFSSIRMTQLPGSLDIVAKRFVDVDAIIFRDNGDGCTKFLHMNGVDVVYEGMIYYPFDKLSDIMTNVDGISPFEHPEQRPEDRKYKISVTIGKTETMFKLVRIN